MTDDPDPQAPTPAEPEPAIDQPGEPRMVRMLHLRRNRRQAAEERNRARRAGLAPKGIVPAPSREGDVTVWADGYGPDAEPPEGSGYDRTPPV